MGIWENVLEKVGLKMILECCYGAGSMVKCGIKVGNRLNFRIAREIV